jgi:hypothetical protein
MAERAQVTSVEAVESFRASLIVYRKNARAALEEARDEVLRTRSWVQDDRRRHWENQTRVRSRKLEEARAELFRARLSQFHESTALQIMAVQRAERSIRAAEAKLAIVKKWDRELENRTDPLLKQVNQLHGFLTTDMAHAVAYLDQMLRTLAAYASVAPPAVAGAEYQPGAGEEKSS